MKASKKNAATIKELDYSSMDCQRLIQEYTRLIKKVLKEYDELADENAKLRKALENYGKSLQETKSSSIPFLFILRKFFTTLQLYGWKITLKKVRSKMVLKK